MVDGRTSDAAVFEQKMTVFRMAGAEGICVVSDWDRTLTHPKMANGQDTTSYLAIVHGGYLGDAYCDEMARLYVKYRGVELATDISEADKLRSMDAWWMAAFELLRDFGLTREMICRCSSSSCAIHASHRNNLIVNNYATGVNIGAYCDLNWKLPGSHFLMIMQ